MSHKNSNGSSPSATTTNGTTSGGAANGDLKYEARLCHVVKRADFDGYGFNLHAEKGRPGQYIGKVDDGSPAESAGLRQGDRIIEVNGTNITNETHKKVVELIKAIPNETKLLVIDPRADAAELKAAIAKAGSKQQQQQPSSVDVNDNSKQKVANGKDSLNDKSPVAAAAATSPTKNKHDVNGSSNGTSTKEDANNKKNANNNVDTSANKMMMTNGDSAATATKKQQQVDQIIEDTKALSVKTAEANGKPQQNGSSNGSTMVTDGKEVGPKLNLNMTAAELRAQLASRKKYDPKSEVTDLRKKYEIIQKM